METGMGPTCTDEKEACVGSWSLLPSSIENQNKPVKKEREPEQLFRMFTRTKESLENDRWISIKITTLDKKGNSNS